jgi:hypothetical protein
MESSVVHLTLQEQLARPAGKAQHAEALIDGDVRKHPAWRSYGKAMAGAVFARILV